MTTLAIHGGTPEVVGRIRRFNTIGQAEVDAAVGCLWGYPLSGFLATEARGGWHVCELERLWCERFGVKHAIAVNSATSGLLIAAQAVLRKGDKFAASPYTMSASVAAPMLMGAIPTFDDIRDDDFSLNWINLAGRAAIPTNLFGHPAQLHEIRKWADKARLTVIEDNAQSIGAMENGKYAGTIGHIGVWSGNIHKAVQAGEIGIVTTDDDGIADELRGRMNHGEVRGGPIGLNLRTTELTAAVFIEQLKKLDDILASRRILAEALNDGVRGLPLMPPVTREGCVHAWNGWACKIPPHPSGDSDVNPLMPSRRDTIVKMLQAEGVPIRAGYMRPLYELPAFTPYKRPCPVTEKVESEIALIELTSIDPTPEQVGQIVAAFHKVYEHLPFEKTSGVPA